MVVLEVFCGFCLALVVLRCLIAFKAPFVFDFLGVECIGTAKQKERLSELDNHTPSSDFQRLDAYLQESTPHAHDDQQIRKRHIKPHTVSEAIANKGEKNNTLLDEKDVSSSHTTTEHAGEKNDSKIPSPSPSSFLTNSNDDMSRRKAAIEELSTNIVKSTSGQESSQDKDAKKRRMHGSPSYNASNAIVKSTEEESRAGLVAAMQQQNLRNYPRHETSHGADSAFAGTEKDHAACGWMEIGAKVHWKSGIIWHKRFFTLSNNGMWLSYYKDARARRDQCYGWVKLKGCEVKELKNDEEPDEDKFPVSRFSSGSTETIQNKELRPKIVISHPEHTIFHRHGDDPTIPPCKRKRFMFHARSKTCRLKFKSLIKKFSATEDEMYESMVKLAGTSEMPVILPDKGRVVHMSVDEHLVSLIPPSIFEEESESSQGAENPKKAKAGKVMNFITSIHLQPEKKRQSAMKKEAKKKKKEPKLAKRDSHIKNPPETKTLLQTSESTSSRDEEPQEDIRDTLSDTENDENCSDEESGDEDNFQDLSENRQGLLKRLAKGLDLSSMSLPVSLNEPTGFLQRLCESGYEYRLLNKVDTLEDPYHRLAFVTAFAISVYHSNIRTTKPFNPYLGETFEYVVNENTDDEYKFVAEQVSHHPPIGVCEAETKHFVFWQDQGLRTKFAGNSMNCESQGESHCMLKKSGDLFSWKMLKSVVHNVILGEMWLDHFGEGEVLNHSTGDIAKIEFRKCGWFSKGRYETKAWILDANGNTKISIEGKWNSHLHATILTGPAFEGVPKNQDGTYTLWTYDEKQIDKTNPWKLPKIAQELNTLTPTMRSLLPKTDTRLRKDRFALEQHDLKLAATEKRRLEERERAKRRSEETKGELWTPKYFDKVDNQWRLTRTYWDKREKRKQRINKEIQQPQ